jgi:thioredoxin-like negative regulator of GroEL
MAGSDTNPYVGLRHYEIDDAARFFGRDSESWELTSLMLASRLVVVYGPSGVGKTSLLHAGVLAGMNKATAQVLPVGRPASTSGLPRAATDYNPFTFRLLSSWAPDLDETTIRSLTIARFLGDLPVGVDRYGEDLPLIAIIDEFEEIFSDVPLWAGHREDFLAQLGQAVEEIDRLHLVVSLKEDMVGEILSYESVLSRRNRTRFRVQPFDRDAALAAVIGPLRGTSRSFASGVAEELVERLMTVTTTNTVGARRTFKTNTVEPISLQVVCSALWDALPDDVTKITIDHLENHGDVHATLTEFCAHAVGDVAEEHRISEVRVWEWLEQAFVTDLGTRNMAYEGVDTTSGMPNLVARGFEQRRILRSERRSGSVWFELLHDGLIEPIRSGRRRAVEAEGGTYLGSRSDSYLLMAESALGYGMSRLAEEFAEQAISASSDDPRTLAEATSLLGKLLLSRGRTEVGDAADELFNTAEDNYRRAAELFQIEQKHRAVAQVLASLGRLFRERGRFTDALSALQGAFSRMPGDIELHLDLARAFNDAGQPQAALSQYESLLTVAPDSVEARVGRGTIRAEHGDPAAALADLEEAIRLSPEVAERPAVVAAITLARERLEGQDTVATPSEADPRG